MKDVIGKCIDTWNAVERGSEYILIPHDGLIGGEWFAEVYDIETGDFVARCRMSRFVVKE